jgi:hypothetical protein
LLSNETELGGKAKVAVAGILKAEVVANAKVEVVRNVKAAVAVTRLRLAADTSRIMALLHIAVRRRRSVAIQAEDFLVAAQFKHSVATRAAVILVVTKGVDRIAINKVIRRHRTSIPKAIAGWVMTGAAAIRVIIRIACGSMDASAAKLAATTFTGSKAEAATVSGSEATSGVSRRTTTTTPAIGCGTATTSSYTTIQIILAGIWRITLDSAPMFTCSI